MSDNNEICGLCGQPMPKGEESFRYHGFSGPCPKPPKQLEIKNIETALRKQYEPSQPFEARTEPAQTPPATTKPDKADKVGELIKEIDSYLVCGFTQRDYDYLAALIRPWIGMTNEQRGQVGMIRFLANGQVGTNPMFSKIRELCDKLLADGREGANDAKG